MSEKGKLILEIDYLEHSMSNYIIKELELSINNICNLRCKHCGFFTPNQPYPTISRDTISDHLRCLKILEKNSIIIETLVIVGGEPLITPQILDSALDSFKELTNIQNIELVSNGLYPIGLTDKALRKINKLAISAYFNNEEFIDSWKSFIKKKGPHISLSFRINKKWDPVEGDIVVSDVEAQKIFENCWYRKHCVTIERDRLFICSLSAKKEDDETGMYLHDKLSQNEIINYLEKNTFINSCRTCIPSMGLDKITPGQQENISSINDKVKDAISYLQDKK